MKLQTHLWLRSRLESKSTFGYSKVQAFHKIITVESAIVDWASNVEDEKSESAKKNA